MSVQGRTADNKTWQLSVLPPDRRTITSFAFSPDGATLALAATSEGQARLWLRRLDVLQPIPLDGTDDASYPFWSPDSRAIGFFAQGKLKKVSMSGGPPEILCDAPLGNGGSWNRQGTIIFTPGIFDGLFRIPASGGKPVQITIRDKTHSENSHRWPYFLPDGKHYLYMIRSEKSGIYVGQLGSPVSKRLIDNDSPAVYATGPDNRSQILFSRAFTLMAQRFDADSGRMLGEAYPLVPDVPADPLRGWGSFSVATAGRLVYQQLSSSGSVRHLVYLDRQGREHGLPLSNDASTHLTMSPDGKQVALQRPTGGATAETWILDAASTTARRFAVNGTFPIWSADGKRILLFAFRNGNFGLFHKSVNGADESELLLPSTAPKFPLDWSADQRFILFRQDNPETGSDIFVFSLNGTNSVAFLNSAHNERDAQFSPDGKWIAYTSDDLGSSEVWVQAFQGAQPASGPRWQVSQHGGGKPKWRRDGRELFFIAADGALMAAAVSSAESIFSAGDPRRLFSTRMSMNDVSQQYTPLPDGKGFFALPLSSGPSQPVTVVSDWKSSRP